MDNMEIVMTWLVEGGILVLLSVLWYLLKQKDEQQAKEIEILWAKHDSDAADLASLKLQIAGKHYERGELDVKFDRLDTSIIKGFAEMGAQFRLLSDTLIAHMSREEGGRRGDSKHGNT